MTESIIKDLLFYVSTFLFLVWLVRNTFFWVSLWQIKEYRLDRFLAHFRETAKGRAILLSPMSLLKWCVLFLYIVPALNDHLIGLYQISVEVLYIFQGGLVLREIATRRFKRPIPTLRSLSITVLAIGVLFLLFTIPLVERSAWYVLLDRITPIVVVLFVYLFAVPSDFIKDIRIEQAMSKLQLHKKVLVIGISGSYGKSSTKEYIAQVLGTKLKVLKTEGSHNTPIGIAQTILQGLKKDTEVFVVELGSYKRGEIAELCQIVQPKIGVTTAISNQHLSLFGSFENIIQTEKELIDALPADGLALFNGNNEQTYLFGKQVYKPKILYEAYYEKKVDKRRVHPDIWAYNIVSKKTGLSFTVQLRGKPVHIDAPLLGVHAVENILPAIYLASYLGMSQNEIKTAVANLVPLAKRMIPRKLVSGAVAIDDSFNASPESVGSAIAYMQLYSGKKILVLEPMIELGKSGKEDHTAIGKLIGKTCDMCFVTNRNFYSQLSDGIKASGGSCTLQFGSIRELAIIITKITEKNDIVVFEGKEAGSVLTRVK